MFNDPKVVIIVCLAVLLAVAFLSALVSRGGVKDFPYVALDALLSPAERSFYGVLQQALSPKYQIMAKVRLADIIEVRRGLDGKRRQSAFNRISAKHLDFVACDPQTFKVVGVIELDDSSHRATKRQQRDKFLDSALAAASIPIVHIAAQRSYAVTTIREQIEAVFNPATQPPPMEPISSPTN